MKKVRPIYSDYGPSKKSKIANCIYLRPNTKRKPRYCKRSLNVTFRFFTCCPLTEKENGETKSWIPWLSWLLHLPATPSQCIFGSLWFIRKNPMTVRLDAESPYANIEWWCWRIFRKINVDALWQHPVW